MSRRRLFSLLNTVALVAALAVWFLFPQYAIYALYAITAWIAVGFGVTWSTLRTPTSAASSPGAGAAPLPASAPALPSGAGGETTTIDFCIYCGNRYAPEERRCASCGHALPPHPLPG